MTVRWKNLWSASNCMQLRNHFPHVHLPKFNIYTSSSQFVLTLLLIHLVIKFILISYFKSTTQMLPFLINAWNIKLLHNFTAWFIFKTIFFCQFCLLFSFNGSMYTLSRQTIPMWSLTSILRKWKSFMIRATTIVPIGHADHLI